MTHLLHSVIGLKLFFTLIVSAHAQDTPFVRRSEANLILNEKTFYAVGMNSYFLQSRTAYGDTLHVNEVLMEAKQMGVTTLRTWGFHDSPDSSNDAVLQYSPGHFNESGLQALDFIVAKAAQCSLRLIIPLVNNWEDYGGMNQYVRWYADQYPARQEKNGWPSQYVITGNDGRRYHYVVGNGNTHDDFYSNPVIKQWYKNYIQMLLERTNSFSNVRYKDDPAILAWELANEPRSSDPSGQIISAWADEISTFIKSIDSHHLVATGEEGYDTSPLSYHESLYNNVQSLFDGSSGVSFTKNTSLPNIDIAGIHCYPELWGMNASAALHWLNDHQSIAAATGKPLIVGEIGKRSQAHLFYEAFLNEAYFINCAGVLPWQFVYDDYPFNDMFAFSYPDDEFICSVIQSYAHRFEQKRNNQIVLPSQLELFQNYPNPFNALTVVTFNLPNAVSVRLDVVNILGQRVRNLIDNDQQAGSHSVLFDGSGFASGTYFLHINIGGDHQTRKITLVR